jgi:peptidoglycan/xylan/chitin deacetylase (PgdA/CDA1 family)
MHNDSYPRDLVGYGRNTPDPRWPGDARIAVQFVVNYEEGGESSILDGDPASENLLSEIVGAQPWPGQRNLNMESIYEYGSRAGFWRLWRMFTGQHRSRSTASPPRSPATQAVAAMKEADWEIASHGLQVDRLPRFHEGRRARRWPKGDRLHAESRLPGRSAGTRALSSTPST